ncbi:TIGR02996 domain-containing protein [Candidatus Parcubacteria bacterium]|nr:MAG: TIGR02996 domain-containing protein [Candidatus Parcubacteria bacterium]
MSQKELLNAICENPFNDDLRLLYADWLEEQGGLDSERAERIRIQMEIAKQFDPDKRPLASPENDKHQDYITSVYNNHKELMALDWVDFINCNLIQDKDTKLDTKVEYKRGLIEKLQTNRLWWYDYGSIVVKHNPILKLEFYDFFPLHIGPFPGGCFVLHSNDKPIFPNVDSWSFFGSPGTMRTMYCNTLLECHKFISEQGINWARNKAGMKPLDFQLKKVLL